MDYSRGSMLSLHPFRSRTTRERKDLVSSSLTSSHAISERLASWSGSKDRSRPCSMKFHKEWQHPDCKVMKWYQEQTQSSTKFTSIQHWSSTEGPFFHEYLLIKLTDGNICRVERMGEGSRTNALSWVGCNAHDIIQWFPAEKYDNNSFYQKPPRLIIEVSFPQPFDILDVLAICYSTQKHRRSGSYTLQRYNCYFLCSTILAILTRRAGEWENSIAEAEWTDLVEDALGELTHVTDNSENALEFFSFGIFSLLHPRSSNPASFALESLRAKLGGTTLCSLNLQITTVLWHTDLHLAVENGLLPSLGNATRTILEGSSSNPGLHSLLPLPRIGEEPNPETDPNPPLIRKAVAKASVQALSDAIAHFIECKRKKLHMRELETKRSLFQRLATSALRTTVIYPWLICKGLARALREGDTDTLMHEAQNRYHIGLTRIFSAIPISTMMAGGVFFLPEEESEMENDGDLCDAVDIVIKVVVEQFFKIIRTFLVENARNAEGALTFLRFYLAEDTWTMGLWSCVLEKIGARMHTLPTRKTVTVTTTVTEGRLNSSQIISIAKFQDHLLKRIQDHANRVEQFKLAAAPLVRADIKNTMSDIWRTLPPHFGGSTATQSPTDCARQKLTQLPSVNFCVKYLKQHQARMTKV